MARKERDPGNYTMGCRLSQKSIFISKFIEPHLPSFRRILATLSAHLAKSLAYLAISWDDLANRWLI